MIFTVGACALTLATFANFGDSLIELHSAIINRGHYNLPAAISEGVLSLSDEPNKPVVECISPVVHHRDTTYYDLSG